MSSQVDADHEVLTLGEAARFIRVSEKTVREMVRQQRLPGQKAGREWRFLKRALEEWLAGRAAGVAEPPAPVYHQEPLLAEPPAAVADTRGKGFGDTAFTNNRREPLHRWVPWVAGFSAAFVEDVYDETLPHKSGRVTVLDPFAGVGTTLVEGLKRGYDVIGFEINPYALLACRTKMQARDCDLQAVTSAVERFSKFMQRRTGRRSDGPKSEPPEGFKTRRPFFSPLVERQVLFVLDFIAGEQDEFIRDMLRVALGAVMVSVSNYSYEPSLGTRAAAGKPDVLDADVRQILEAKLWQMQADMSFLREQMKRLKSPPRAEVSGSSYLAASESPAQHSVDLLVTSPPYLNNYHYIRNTRPQLYWLGLVGQPSDTKDMEQESFGRFWQTVRALPAVELAADIPELHSLLDSLAQKNPEKGVYGGRGWANYAATYFNDCDRFCQVTRRVMKPGGSVVVVIGNNILQGVQIRTDEIFAQIAEMRGFQVQALHRVRTKRTGSSIINSSVRAGKAKQRVELYETAVELTAPG